MDRTPFIHLANLMRYNERELALYGRSASTAGGIDKEGYLYKRGDKPREGYKRRWFVLKGNLLFYFRDQNTNEDPMGCIVLERVSVANFAEPTIEFGFKLEFDAAERCIYYFYAMTQEQRQEWTDLLRTASYEALCETFAALRQRLSELMGRDPIGDGMVTASQPAVPAADTESAAQAFVRSATFATGLRPAHRPSAGAGSPFSHGQSHQFLDLTLGQEWAHTQLRRLSSPMPHLSACRDLVLRPTSYPSAVSVSLLKSKDSTNSSWEIVTTTEATADTQHPKFNTIMSLALRLYEPTTKLRFVVTQHERAKQTEEDVTSPGTLATLPPGMPIDGLGEDEDDEAMLNSSSHTMNSTSTHSSLPTSPHQSPPAATDRNIGMVELSMADLFRASEGDSAVALQVPIGPNLPFWTPPEGFEDAAEPTSPFVPSGTLIIECTRSEGFTGVENSWDAHPLASMAAAAAAAAVAKGAVGGGSGGSRLGTASMSSGTSSLQPRLRERVCRLIKAEPVSRSFTFPTLSGPKLKITDVMRESPFIYGIPMQLLKLYKQEDSETVVELQSLGKLVGPVQSAWRIERERCLTRIPAYQEQLAYLDMEFDTTFKRSVQKKDKRVEMVATNLHAQMMQVTLDYEGLSKKPSNYVTLTMGCPAAHCQGFKQGGMRTLLKHLHQENEPPVDIDYAVKELEEHWNSFQQCVRVFRSYNDDDAEVLEANMKAVKDFVQLFIDFLNSAPMRQVFARAEESRPRRGPIVVHGSPTFSRAGSSRSHLSAATTSMMVTNEAFIGREVEMQPASGFGGGGGGSGAASNGHPSPNKSGLSAGSPGTGLAAPGASSSTAADSTIAEDMKTSLAVMLDQLTSVDKSAPREQRYLLLDRLGVAFQAAYLDARECLSIVRLRSRIAIHSLPDLIWRRDVIFSQMLTALVTSFVDQLLIHHHDRSYGFQLFEAGFLVHMSSLLSTQGDEEAMIEDTEEAMKDMATVTFSLSAVAGGRIDPYITGRRYQYNVDLGVPPAIMQHMPESLRNGARIPVRPALFSQGVNEMQTLANKVGDITLQEEINRVNYEALYAYAVLYKETVQKHQPESMQTLYEVDQMLAGLKEEICSGKLKNIEILVLSEMLARHMRGGRITCCKSGKDRTGMAVTLEFVNILVQHHHMHQPTLQQALDTLRTRGTRRENVKKNIGDDRYAFNSLQVRTLPKLLRPPEGTFGSAVA